MSWHPPHHLPKAGQALRHPPPPHPHPSNIPTARWRQKPPLPYTMPGVTLGQHASAGWCPMWQNYIGNLPHRQDSQCGRRRPLQAARTHGGRWASLGGNLCKSALQGGKLNSSPPSLQGVAAGVADVQPAAGISFSRMAANQASCPSTQQATKSSSLTVRTVLVEGAILLCEVVCAITSPLVPPRTDLQFFQPSPAWPTLAYVPPSIWWLPILSGRAWAKARQLCAATANSARVERSTSSQQLNSTPSQSLHVARRPGGSSGSLFGMPCVPVDRHWQVQVGGGGASMQYGGQYVHRSLHRQLGGTFCQASHFRSYSFAGHEFPYNDWPFYQPC